MEKSFELIVSVVKKGQSDKIVRASREAGATGGTIIYGRGSSLYGNNSVMGVDIQSEKEVILTLVESASKTQIMKKICKASGLDCGKEGIIFSLPVKDILGTKKFIESQKEKLPENFENSAPKNAKKTIKTASKKIDKNSKKK